MLSKINDLCALLKTRAHGNPDEYFVEILWENEIKCVCADISASIKFVISECTDEEFYFLSEIFDDIMRETKSIDFLKCIRERVNQVEDFRWKDEIMEDIEFAALYVDEEDKA